MGYWQLLLAKIWITFPAKIITMSFIYLDIHEHVSLIIDMTDCELIAFY